MTTQARHASTFAGTVLVAAFSGAYVTKLGLSPVYPMVLAGLGVLLTIALAGHFAAPRRYWLLAMVVACLSVPFLGFHADRRAAPQDVLNLLLGPALLCAVLVAGHSLDASRLRRIAAMLVLCTVALATFECGWRLTHPDYTFLDSADASRVDIDEVGFYAYKFSSVMYVDSNFVGLQLAVLWAFVLALRNAGFGLSRWLYVVVPTLVVLTLSRASVIAMIAVSCVDLLLRSSAVTKLATTAVAGALAGAVFLHVSDDGSFQSKLRIAELFLRFVDTASLGELAFGVGVGRAVSQLGIGAHNLVVTYVVEIGAIPTLILGLSWAALAFAARGNALLITALVVNGVSLTTFAVPYLYVSAALLVLIARSGRPASQRTEPRTVPGPLPLPT